MSYISKDELYSSLYRQVWTKPCDLSSTARYVDLLTVINVDIKGNGENRVVIVEFLDGTTEKAVASGDDVFNLERGIQICLAKKAFKVLFGKSNEFNKRVNKAVKHYQNKVAASEKEKEETLLQEARAKKRAEKKAKWLECKKAKERETRVNEMAEAYAKAMKMVNEESKN